MPSIAKCGENRIKNSLNKSGAVDEGAGAGAAVLPGD
jgi:hypothetical protein